MDPQRSGSRKHTPS